MFSLLMLDSQSVLRSTWKIFVHFLGDYRTEESCRWVPIVHNGVSKKSDFRTLFRHSRRDAWMFKAISSQIRVRYQWETLAQRSEGVCPPNGLLPLRVLCVAVLSSRQLIDDAHRGKHHATLKPHSPIRDSNSFIERWLVFFDELLRTPAGAHLGGVDVAFGIHRNLVKEDKLTSITANPSKAPQFPQCFTIK
jgi:hypothetical protein